MNLQEAFNNFNNNFPQFYKIAYDYCCKLCSIHNRTFLKDEIATAVLGDFWIDYSGGKINFDYESVRKYFSHSVSKMVHCGEHNVIEKRIVNYDISEISESYFIPLDEAVPIGLPSGYRHLTEEFLNNFESYAKNHTTKELADRFGYTIKTTGTMKSRFKIKSGKLSTSLEAKIDEIKKFCEEEKTYKEIAEKFNVSESGVWRFCEKYNIKVKRRRGKKLELQQVLDILGEKKYTQKEASVLLGVSESVMSDFQKKAKLPNIVKYKKETV